MAENDFFIGWKPMPRRFALVVGVAAVVFVLTGGVLAVVLASAQPSPGGGVGEDELRAFEGQALVEPYAMLRTTDESGKVRTILLVDEGKFGAADRLRPFAGQTVRVRGTLLHREGRWMVELSADEEIERIELPAVSLRNLKRVSHGSVTLKGEIIDPKCYLGAMKPGGGKTHKACAALCLAGGIPPMLVVRRRDEREEFWLLVREDGGEAGEVARDWVGEPVEVRGWAEEVGDLRILRVGEKGISQR